MPKEVIKNKETQAELGWSRESAFVQLGVVNTDESAKQEDRGYFVSLDRDDINRLIANLRRARNNVYGRDE